MILISITSDESPQSIFKKQADAAALEEWAKTSPYNTTMTIKEHAEYLTNLGRKYIQSKKVLFLL